jgi:hypothetical protein
VKEMLLSMAKGMAMAMTDWWKRIAAHDNLGGYSMASIVVKNLYVQLAYLREEF